MLDSAVFSPEIEIFWRIKIIFPFPLRFRIQDAGNAAGVGGEDDRIGGEWAVDIFTEK